MIRYTRHALERMKKRRILEESVSHVVLSSVERYVDEERGVLIAVKRETPPLIVAYRIDGRDFVIVTVYTPSNIDKVVERKVRLRRWRPWLG